MTSAGGTVAEPETAAERIAGHAPATAGHTPAAAEHAQEEQLAQLVSGLWRALVRATRSAHGLPALHEAQVALLHRLVAAGPLPPAKLAAEMHLARSTVSNLARDLVAEGLLERRPSPTDARSVLLAPTARAHDVLATFSRGRIEVLDAALSGMPAGQRQRVIAALPSLGDLLERLEAMAEQGTTR